MNSPQTLTNQKMNPELKTFISGETGKMPAPPEKRLMSVITDIGQYSQ